MATFIRPEAVPNPLEDDALIDAMQATVVGVTGLDPTLVRPRNQPAPPNLPDFSLNWASLGLTVTDSDSYAFVRQVNDTDMELEHDQEITLLAIFYGSSAQSYVGLLRDGLQIEQNRWALGALGVKLVSTGRERHIPSLLKEIWQQRYDLPVVWRRRVRRVYKSASVIGVSLGLDNEHYITPIVVSPPTP
ncbi:hypothetical protein ZHS_18 [Edwardsiella phage vB_EpM_ZHS]|jgi:hypothetical protein|nr:hypothetical protein ZHS_18 [Edwardsiella phage vB_EpM_ZHS]